jgi:REP element-mobilizing transposase RayT
VGRELRIIDPKSTYHAVSNGNNGGRLVLDRIDCEIFLEELGKAATRYEWEVFSWCLLTTHWHIVLRTPKGGFSEGFQGINGNHSRRTNRRHDRRDHLFRNRPYCEPVVSEAHFVGSIVYVARNPVAAGICTNAAAWPHGSYRALAGLDPAPSWLAVDRVLPLFGRTAEVGRRGFARIVHNGHLLVSDTKESVKTG